MPRSTERRSVQTYRAGPALRRLIRSAARQDRQNPAEWVRLTLEREARRRVEEAEVALAREELGRYLGEMDAAPGARWSEADAAALGRAARKHARKDPRTKQ